MKRSSRTVDTELAVVGTGLAGFAASIFALDRGLSVAQVGNTGAIAYTTGYFDLFGADGTGKLLDPWAGLAGLRESEPDHPLSRIEAADIRTAFGRFTEAVSAMGVTYTAPGDDNLTALLPAGVLKPTFSVPATMLPGIEARARGTTALIVDFTGLQGFSAAEFVANLSPAWPGLAARTLDFMGLDSGRPLFPEVAARALEVAPNREQLADLLKPHLNGAGAVGLPAVLGVHRPDDVHAALQALLGVPVFEVPTLPPAVPGIRLREMFEHAFPARGLALVAQQKVERLELGPDVLTLGLKDSYGDVTINAKAAVLATGRFLSGGLAADRERVREPLLGLPVAQPETREAWHREDYLDARGHPINRAGIETDAAFRPLGPDGAPVDPRLFAAGSLLAHQDWIRQRAGAGVAIATAFKAVEAAADILQEA